jgi:hypothetical protein
VVEKQDSERKNQVEELIQIMLQKEFDVGATI